MEKLNKQQKQNKPLKRKKAINWKNLIVTVSLVIYTIVNAVTLLKDAEPITGDLDYSTMMKYIEEDKVSSINITKNSSCATLYTTDGEIYNILNPQSDTFIEDLMKLGVNVTIQKATLATQVMTFVLTIPVIIITALILVYLMNLVVGAGTDKFHTLKAKDNYTTFNDVRGITETKEEVKFLVDRIHDWKKLGELGARPVKGVLFYGPPGTGKTLLAKAIAKEANVPFISASGSDFNEMFVGLGAARVRSLWELATTNAPCILFIDEIDCLGAKRGIMGTHSENNQTLNCLLQKMDGLDSTPGVLVIGATNRKEDLDPALLRSGRFDRQYYVGYPSSKDDRDSVVKLYLNNKKLEKNVTVEKVSKLLVQMSAADIEEVLSDAVYISLQNNRNGILKLSDIDEAAMKLRLGGVKKEHTSKRDEIITAIHESGHTVMSLLLNEEVAKVSIIPYSSGTGGLTVRDLDKKGDIKLKLKSEYEKELKILLAGKIAEELIMGEHTQGCSNDLELASKQAYHMITTFGFGDKLINIEAITENSLSTQQNEQIKASEKLLQQINNSATEQLSKTDNRLRIETLANELLVDKTIVEPTLEFIDNLPYKHINIREIGDSKN